jgi:hypothetical protein
MNGLIIAAYTGNVYQYSYLTKLVNYEYEYCEVNKNFRIDMIECSTVGSCSNSFAHLLPKSTRLLPKSTRLALTEFPVTETGTRLFLILN